MRRVVRGLLVVLAAVAALAGCRDFRVGEGRQQDHAMLSLSRKGAGKVRDLGSVGEGALSSKTVNPDLILRTADRGTPTPQQITLTGADTVPAMASWAGVTVEEFLRANPALRTRHLKEGDALYLSLSPGQARRFHGLRKAAVARWQLQRESGQAEPVRVVDHVMAEGEGIPDLLEKFHTTEDLLMRVNGAVRMGSLRAGQTVKVPLLP